MNETKYRCLKCKLLCQVIRVTREHGSGFLSLCCNWIAIEATEPAPSPPTAKEPA